MFSTTLRGVLAALGLGAAALAVSAPSAQAQEPILGTVQSFGFNFCPRGWTEANGNLLPISSNSALFSLFGTIYGGDGRTTFGLPDLRGRAPVNYGTGPGLQSLQIGQRYGNETHVLTQAQLPSHSHNLNASNQDATKHGPGNDFLAVSYYQDGTKLNIYGEGPANRTMDPDSVSATGGGASFNITAPRLAVNYCVALVGLYPSRN